MQVIFLKSYDKSFNKLNVKLKRGILKVEENIIKIIAGKERPYPGLGLKKLKRNYWEVRIGLKERILFKLAKECLTFILIGSHDEIKRAID